MSQELQVLYHFPEFGQKLQHPFASVSEEGCAGRNTKEASNAQTHEAPSFPGLENTLEIHGFSSCRNPMGLISELFVEDTGRKEAYELVSLQPSVPSCLYQYFLMPSQEGVVVVKVPSKILVVFLLTISSCSEQLHVFSMWLVVELESKM